MMASLRTAIFFVGWVAMTALLGAVALPVLLSQRATWRVAHAWTTLTLFWLRISCGVRTQVRGVEYKPVGGALVACKHQSAWDTLVLWRTLKNPAFVLKKQLYLIPVFGWYLWRSGQIAIDRKAGRVAMRSMLEQGKLLAAQGRTIVIFPEGTRVPPGEALPFHAGVARLSQALGLCVTPAALNGGLFWPKHSVKKFPGTAILEFLPPQPVFVEPVAPWLVQLQHVVNTRTAQLEREAP